MSSGKNPKLKTYEVGIPIKEVWIFRVKATSKKEAIRLAGWNSETVEQIGSTSGSKAYCIEVPNE